MKSNFKKSTMDKNSIAVSTYEKIAAKYARQYFEDLTDSAYIDEFLEKLPKKGVVLDAGCGPGQFSQYMARKGFEVVGIDFSNEMLEIAKQKVQNVHFRHMDMRKLDFDEATFDGILSAYSLIHITSDDIPVTLKNFHRVLKPVGFIEVIAQKGDPDMVIDEPFMPGEKMFFNFFTKERLSKFLNNAGFQVSYQVEADSQDPDSVSDKVIYSIANKHL